MQQTKLEEVWDIFIEKLKKTQNKIIEKDDIIRLGEEFGLSFNARSAKAKVVEKIVNEGHTERLFETFKEFIYIPAWEVANFYKVDSSVINSLKKLGIIKEETKEESFYNRLNKDTYIMDTYPIEILEKYSTQELMTAYNEAFKQDEFKIRIETREQDEIHKIINELSKVFIVEEDPAVYERRGKGFNSYLKIKIANNSKLEEKRYLKEIQKLKNELRESREKVHKLSNRIPNISLVKLFEERYGATGFELNYRVREDLDKLEVMSPKLFKNIRNAGRKEKFTLEQKNKIKLLRSSGKKIRDIAAEYKCSVATIHKIISEQ